MVLINVLLNQEESTMKNSKVLKIILFISGLIAASIGAAILFMPVAFYAGSGITVGGDISLLSDIRAAGGALLAIGALVMAGAFVEKLTFTSAIISTLVYLSYGLSRIMSIAIDGLPVDALVQAMALEIILGLVGVFAILKYKENGYVKN